MSHTSNPQKHPTIPEHVVERIRSMMVWVIPMPTTLNDLKVVEEIALRMADGDITKPSDIVFMTVMLTDTIFGPIVMVHGEEGDHRFHCTYYEDPEWVTLSEALEEGLEVEELRPSEKPRGTHH